MTARSSEARAGRAITPAVVLCAAVLGLGGGLVGFTVDPRLGIAALGLPIVVLIAASPAVGAALLLFALPLEELGALSPGGVLTLHKLLGVLVIGAWLLGVLVVRRPARVPLLTVPLGALVLWGLTSTLWAVDPSTTERVAVTRLQLFGLYLLVVNALDTPVALRRALYAHVAGAVALCGLGLWLAGQGILQAGRAAVVINHELVLEPNAFGGALVLPTTICMVCGLDRTRADLERLLLLAAGAVCFTTVVLTMSRGPLLALGATAILLSVVRRTFALFGLAAVLALPGILIVGPQLWERLTSAATLADRGAGRLDLWRVGWAVIQTHPVVGIGLGCFSLIYLEFVSHATGLSAKHLESLASKMEFYPHNIYVGVAAELGIVGLVLLLATLFAHLRGGFVAWRALATRRSPHEGLVLVGVAALAALTIEAATFDIAHRKYLWLTLGLTALGRGWAPVRAAAVPLRRAA